MLSCAAANWAHKARGAAVVDSSIVAICCYARQQRRLRCAMESCNEAHVRQILLVRPCP